jgi:hypothetical protein
MKRDWDTIRELLNKVEECTLPTEMVRLADFDEQRAAAISYHMSLLIEAGLVKGQVVQTTGPEVKEFFAQSLTWEGHEFLDSIRNDTVWTKTKKVFTEKGIEMSFDLVKSVAQVLVKAALGGTSDNQGFPSS